MVSSALTTLRGLPQKQADVYNEYVPPSTKVRQDIYISGPARLAQLERLVTSAQNALQGLQDSANAAEAKIQAAAQPANADVNEAAVRKVFYAFDNGMDLASVCELLVSDNDRDGFAALTANLRLLAKTGKLKFAVPLPLDRLIKEAEETISARYRDLATREEQMLQAEVQELWCMTYLRNNFKALFDFFTAQLLPNAVAGQFNRLESVYTWMGLNDESIARLHSAGIEWDKLPSGVKILLVSDIPQRFSYGYDAQTGGEARSPSPYTTNHDSYMAGVRGAPGTGWQDTPVRLMKGSMQGNGRF